jgi:hypothetical protein
MTFLVPRTHRHCEYQSFENLHVKPAAHVVQPAKLTPPHCAYCAAVHVGGALGMVDTVELVLVTGGGARVDVVLVVTSWTWEEVLVVWGRVVTVEKVVDDEMAEVKVRVKMGMSTLVVGSTGAPTACQ